jgi:peptide/nickel transport system permease protein
MKAFILRRLLVLPPLLLGISALTFVVSRLSPVDPVTAALGDVASTHPEIVAQYRAQWGLDRPLVEQYVVYLAHLVRGDLGVSLTSHRPVSSDVFDYFPATIELATAALVIAAAAGCLLAIGGVLSRPPVSQALEWLSVAQVSVPVFWLALTALTVIDLHLPFVPTGGQLDPGVPPPLRHTGLIVVDALLAGRWTTLRNALLHLIVPALVLASYWVGFVSILLRGTLEETLRTDYVRTAFGKGLPGSRIVLRHAFKNAAIPVVTVLGVLYGQLLGGTILIESIFSWPGLGFYAYQAASNIDFPGIMGVTLIVAVSFVLVNLLVDTLYVAMDPRLRFD